MINLHIWPKAVYMSLSYMYTLSLWPLLLSNTRPYNIADTDLAWGGGNGSSMRICGNVDVRPKLFCFANVCSHQPIPPSPHHVCVWCLNLALSSYSYFFLWQTITRSMGTEVLVFSVYTRLLWCADFGTIQIPWSIPWQKGGKTSSSTTGIAKLTKHAHNAQTPNGW